MRTNPVATRGARGIRVALGTWAAGAMLATAGCGAPAPIIDCVARDGTTPVCGFQNPEDLAALSADWLVVSQAPRGDSGGNLLAYRPAADASPRDARRTLWPAADSTASEPASPGCPGPPDEASFVPHGVDRTRDGATLLVVNHGGREAVEFFEIGRDERGPTLRWVDCVLMPADAMMNDIASLPDGGFVISQMASSTVSGMVALMTGGESGRIHHWPPGGPLRGVPGSEAAGANGVETSADGRSIYFAEWVGENFVRMGIDGSDRQAVPLGFNPDNLTWRANGQLLVGGQFASPLRAAGCFDVSEGTCGLGSAAAVIDPESLAVERVWTHDPATVAGGISVALEHGDRIWLGTFGGDRLAWIPAP